VRALRIRIGLDLTEPLGTFANDEPMIPSTWLTLEEPSTEEVSEAKAIFDELESRGTSEVTGTFIKARHQLESLLE